MYEQGQQHCFFEIALNISALHSRLLDALFFLKRCASFEILLDRFVKIENHFYVVKRKVAVKMLKNPKPLLRLRHFLAYSHDFLFCQT